MLKMVMLKTTATTITTVVMTMVMITIVTEIVNNSNNDNDMNNDNDHSNTDNDNKNGILLKIVNKIDILMGLISLSFYIIFNKQLRSILYFILLYQEINR